MKNTIPPNFTSTVSINSNDKKVRYKMNCYSHMNCNFLQFIGQKQKIYWYNNIKWKLKEVNIKNRMSYFFDKMINIKNLDWNKIKIDEKSYK